MNPERDLYLIIALAQAQSEGKQIPYCPGVEMAYARTIDYLSRNWMPKLKDELSDE